jgi:hypothetical protein
MHRKFVMEHRDDMAAWEVRKENATNLYPTELKEWLESKVDPAPQLKEKMIFNKRPDDWNTVQDNPIGGNVVAEESLLAVAMYDPAAIPVVMQLSPQEFGDPLNQKIAQVLVDNYRLNEPTDSIAVEQVLRSDPTVPQEARWDSSMPLGENVDRTNYGLQSWEKNAGVIENAVHYAGEIREQYRATQTMEVTTWAHQQSQALVDVGPSPSQTDQLHRTLRAKLALVPGSLPSQGLGPPSPAWESPTRPFARSVGRGHLTPSPKTSRPPRTTSRART